MAVTLQTTKGAAVRNGVKIITFGPPGSGKTRLCATLPNPVIISAESGLLSLREYNLPFIQIRTLKDFDDAWLWLNGSKEARLFASVAIDSISEIAEAILEWQKGQTKDGRKAYGETQDEVMKIIKKFRNFSGPHIYFSAKQERIENTGGNPPMFYGPMFPGKNLAQQIPYDFDEVFQLVPSKTAEGKSFSALRTRGAHEADIVKDRSGALDEWEMPQPGGNLPSLGHIINKIVAL